MFSLSFDPGNLQTGQTTSDSLSFLSLEVSLEEVAQVDGSDCGCDTISQNFSFPLFPLVPLPSLLCPLWPLLLPLPQPLPLTYSDSLILLSLEEIAVTEGSDWASRRIIFEGATLIPAFDTDRIYL